MRTTTRIVLWKRLAAISFFLIAESNLSAQSTDYEDTIISDLESILATDFRDDRAMSVAVGRLYLQCGALYRAMSSSLANSRPAAALLFNDNQNWYQVVGQALIAAPGEPVSSATTLVEAYIESYGLDVVLHYSEKAMDERMERCNAPNFQEYGNRIVSELENQIHVSQ
jgi:hypothetical protein